VPDNPIFGRAAAARRESGSGESGSGYAAFCARAADGMRESGAFADSEHWAFAWERRYTRDEWLDVVPTTGGHSLFAPEELEQVLTGVGAAVDAAGGSFTVRYTAEVCTAVRRPG
jgi:hypothetical protein